MMRTPLLPFLTTMIAGICISNYHEITQQQVITALIIFTSVLVFCFLKEIKSIVFICLTMIFFLLGILNVNIYLQRKISPNHVIHYANQGKLLLEGIISENHKLLNDKTNIIVDLTKITHNNETLPIEGRIILSLKDSASLKYGDYVRFKTEPKVIHNFGNPGGFDYVKNLKYRKIQVHGSINKISDIVVIRENQGAFLISNIEGIRNYLREQIKINSSSPNTQIIQAIILGERKEIPEDIVEAFRLTGTSHILAISGFHVGIVTLVSFFIVRLLMKSSTYILLRWNIMVVSAVIAIFPIIFYAIIAGLGISVLRASIMAIFMMLALILAKERDIYNTLALAAIIILIISPNALFDISFQLSFSAVWAILFISPRLIELIPQVVTDDRYSVKNYILKLKKNLLIFLIVTASATLGTLPLIVYYFNQISTVTFLANSAVVPLIGFLALPSCMAFIISAPFFPFLSEIFINFASLNISAGISIARFFASLPGSHLQMSTPTAIEIALYYLLLISAVKSIDFSYERKDNERNDRNIIPQNINVYRIIFASLCLFFIINFAYLHARDAYSNKLTVTAIDVGQGSSTLIQFPGGKRMLIDGGGFQESTFDVGKLIVSPFLRHKRIKQLDFVVLSHPHPDHLNGLLYILSKFDVKEVWTNGYNIDSEASNLFRSLIEEKGIFHRIVSSRTEKMNISNVLLEVLNPLDPVTNNYKDVRNFENENNLSIVMRLTYGRISFLFPSDISEPAETRLVKSGHNITSQVLFVPHHGGFTSSTPKFLDHVHPQIAIVSCGLGNIYKLPHPDVIARYERIGTSVFRTDKNGAIEIETCGNNISISTFRRDLN